MTTKEVAQICGVTDRTVSGNAQKAGVVLKNGKSHDWTEEELKRLQLVLMKNSVSAGGQKTEESIVKENLESTFEVGLVAKACLDSPEAWEQFKRLGDSLVEQKLQAKQLEAENKLLLEQKEQAEANYQAEKQEHQKDKELVLHKYLTATQIKETIFKEYGKNIVVSKAVQRIPLDDNDILYKPFKNGDYTGQQPVYHPDVLDKIREILG